MAAAHIRAPGERRWGGDGAHAVRPQRRASHEGPPRAQRRVVLLVVDRNSEFVPWTDERLIFSRSATRFSWLEVGWAKSEWLLATEGTGAEHHSVEVTSQLLCNNRTDEEQVIFITRLYGTPMAMKVLPVQLYLEVVP